MGIAAKLGVALVVLAGAGVGAAFLLRPVAAVAIINPGRAPNVVPGSVTVVAEGGVFELKSQVGGKVVWMEAFDPGRRVKEGETLVKLDTTDLETDIEYTKKDFEAAKERQKIGTTTEEDLVASQAALRQAEVDYKADRIGLVLLEKQRRDTQSLKQKSENEKLSNRITVEGYERSLKLKQIELERMTIKAPAEMVVSEVKIQKGALVSPNTILGTLIKTTRTVEAKIAEENFAGIALGQPCNVSFLPYGNFLYHGKVQKILPTADAETGRHIIHLEMTDIELEKLVPGYTGDVRIKLDERDAKALVPRRALQGDYVFVVDGGRVQRRHIRKGYASQTYVEILDPEKPGPGEGLRAGEQVIVENLDQFRDGDRVRAEVVEAAPKA